MPSFCAGELFFYSLRRIFVRVIPINSDFRIDTDLLQLKFKQGVKPGFFLRSRTGTVTIVYPPGVRFETQRMQQWLHRVVMEALRVQAKALLPGRLADYATRHGFSYQRVTIKNMRTRWGSCSSRGNINLSLYLLFFPSRLVDYVLLHELCHTREMNHGPRFWALLDALTDGQAKALRAELRESARRLAE